MTTSATPATVTASRELIADRYAPRYDTAVRSHLTVDADADRTYAATRALDLLDVHGGLVDAAMWVRAVPERWRRRKQGPPRRRTRLTLDDLAVGTEWVFLGETAGTELAMGVAGRFWRPTVEWREVAADRFVEFDEAGYAKIVMSFSVRPYGDRRTLVTSDIRVVVNDTLSKLKFDLYWRTTAPFVRGFQRAMLETIKTSAEQAMGTSAP